MNFINRDLHWTFLGRQVLQVGQGLSLSRALVVLTLVGLLIHPFNLHAVRPLSEEGLGTEHSSPYPSPLPPLSQRFHTVKETLEQFRVPSVLPFGRPHYRLKSLSNFQEALDALAYQVFYQFHFDDHLRERLWQLYFDSSSFNYSNPYTPTLDIFYSSFRLREGTSEERSLAEGLYGSESDPNSPDLIQSRYLRSIPNWARIFRLQALIEIAHEHQLLDEMNKSGNRTDYRHQFEPMEAVNTLYSTMLTRQIFTAAPQAELLHELHSASPELPEDLRDSLTLLLQQAQELSESTFMQTRLPLNMAHFGLKREQLQELVDDFQLKWAQSEAKTPPREKWEKSWINFHEKRLAEKIQEMKASAIAGGTCEALLGSAPELTQQLFRWGQEARRSGDSLLRRAVARLHHHLH